MTEQDIITHLLNVESMAYEMLFEAQTEADKRKLEAQEQAEKDYLTAYEREIKKFEDNFEKQKIECEEERNTIHQKHKENLDAIDLSYNDFNSFLENYYFGS